MIIDPVFKVTAEGITAPSFDEILDFYKNQARLIFGTDINLDEDTQDGQLLALFALALHNVNAQAIATYNTFSPKTAKGAGLDVVVAVNGLKRKTATHSQADLTIIGQVGTEIKNGIASDSFENKWLLPPLVVIPTKGEITVTATAEKAGAITAEIGAIATISTPTLGWQSVTNRTPAKVGNAEESDAELRARQAYSTALPSVSLWDGIVSSLSNLEGVKRVSGTKNDTDTTDENGIPAHSIAMIVDGGQIEDIGKTIYLKKGEGVGTYGKVKTVYVDETGYPNEIKFNRPEIVNVFVKLTVKPSATFISSVKTEIQERVTAYVNSLPIGVSVNAGRVLASTIKQNGVLDDRFDVEALEMGTHASVLSVQSIPIKWNQAGQCALENVTIEVKE